MAPPFAVADAAVLTCSTSTRLPGLVLAAACSLAYHCLNANTVRFVMSIAFCGESDVPVTLMNGSGPSRKPPAPEKAYGLTALTVPGMRPKSSLRRRMTVSLVTRGGSVLAISASRWRSPSAPLPLS